MDVRALASALQREIAGEVRFDDGSRAACSTDAIGLLRVVVPARRTKHLRFNDLRDPEPDRVRD
jgi:hypothetical protein